MTTQELRRAAARRKREIADVTSLLKNKPDSLGPDGVWIRDFLNIEGNTAGELARLLVDEKYDSPWILRPDYFQSIRSRLERRLGDL